MQSLIPYNFSTSVVDSSKTNGQFVVNALDSKTNEVIGTVIAEPCLKKSYSGVKFASEYSAQSIDNPRLTSPHMYISDLFVSKDARKKGVGRTLVNRVVKESADRGFNGRVILLAGNSKEASPLPFYKKIGFMSTKLKLNRQLDEFIKNKWLYFDNRIQAFMFLPKKVIMKILQSR